MGLPATTACMMQERRKRAASELLRNPYCSVKSWKKVYSSGVTLIPIVCVLLIGSPPIVLLCILSFKKSRTVP